MNIPAIAYSAKNITRSKKCTGYKQNKGGNYLESYDYLQIYSIIIKLTG